MAERRIFFNNTLRNYVIYIAVEVTEGLLRSSCVYLVFKMTLLSLFPSELTLAGHKFIPGESD